MYNSIKSKIGFGKYKGDLISKLIIENPLYILWCIKNLDNFLLRPSFLKDAIMINNNFRIPDSHLLIFEEKMNSYNKMEEENYEDWSFGEEPEYKYNYSYKEWLISELIPDLIIKEKKRLEVIEEDEKIRKMQVEEWRTDREEREMLHRESCDDSFYNDDLDPDQQSDEFWNQF